MSNAKYFVAFFFGIFLLLSPYTVMAQGATTPAPAPTPTSASGSLDFKNEGIFGCTSNVGQSVGAMAAVGGVYVPVNDAAVTINTGLLVYKFCVLDPMSRKIAENATADISKGVIQTTVQGRGGQAQFVQNRSAELKVRGDDAKLASLLEIKNSSDQFGSSPSDKNKIVQRLAKNYTNDTDWQTRLSSNACPYKDTDATPPLERAFHAGDPRCSAFFSQELFLGPYTDARAAELQENLAVQWDWGNGSYPIEQIDGDQITTVTPAAYVNANGLQAVQSGFRQAENVNAMGEMTTALFTGLAQQIVSDSGGLAGLTRSTGSQPSYLNQLTAETARDVRSSASNAALQVLANARNIEAQYLQLMNTIATNLTDAINQLRNAESQCYALLIPKVQEYAARQVCTTTGGGGGAFNLPPTQTCTGGYQIKAATSTAFSQVVISAQIQPLASNAITNINTSTKAVSLIDQMIAGVTTVTSLSAQRLALQQLDTLVSQKALHSQYDLTAAQQQQAAVKDAMTSLVSDTVKAWADSTDPNIGWCNYNNPAILEFWAQRWKI